MNLHRASAAQRPSRFRALPFLERMTELGESWPGDDRCTANPIRRFPVRPAEPARKELLRACDERDLCIGDCGFRWRCENRGRVRQQG